MVTVKCNVRLQDTDLKCEKEIESVSYGTWIFN